MPKKLTGTAQRNIVTASTIGSNTQYFTENLLVDIISFNYSVLISIRKYIKNFSNTPYRLLPGAASRIRMATE